AVDEDGGFRLAPGLAEPVLPIEEVFLRLRCGLRESRSRSKHRNGERRRGCGASLQKVSTRERDGHRWSLSQKSPGVMAGRPTIHAHTRPRITSSSAFTGK